MRALVTGATGKVGHAIARALAQRGDEVRALVRDPEKATRVLPAGVEPVRGDVTDPPSVAAALAGCEVVFNAMGLPEQWLADESQFDRVNAEGTRTVAQAARAAGVRRLVHTSTEDVFHADPGERFDESQVAGYPKGTAYERSKQRAEQLALAERDGLEVVIVNPAGVYGPGPSASVSFDKGFIEPLVRRRLPALPPGGLGLVYVDGLAQGTCSPPNAGATASATSCATRTSRCATSQTRWCVRRGAAGCRRPCPCRLPAAWPPAARRSRA